MTVINENIKYKTLPLDPLLPPDIATKSDQFPKYCKMQYFQISKESTVIMYDMAQNADESMILLHYAYVSK